MVRQGSQKLNEKIARNKRLVTIATIIIVVAIAFVFVSGVFDSEDKKSSPSTDVRLTKGFVKKIVALGYVNKPINVPINYKRTSVKLIPATKTATGCEEVLQRFLKTGDNSRDFIDIYSYPITCEFERPSDAQGFTVGNYAGWSSTSNKEKSILTEIVVNQNHIRVESDSELKQLVTTMGAFVPFSENSPKDTLKIST